MTESGCDHIVPAASKMDVRDASVRSGDNITMTMISASFAMNPLTNVKNIKKLTEQELQSSNKTSWHDQYKNSAWIFIGGLPYDLTEGDIIAIFSQYGEVVHINLIRDKDTGKQKGYGFLCYEDQRSTILAVDNFNGLKILGRVIRVDHVSNYKAPKDFKNIDKETKKLRKEGCAPKKD